MNCWHCNTSLIWGGDHDVEDEHSEFSVTSNFSCPECGSFVLVYYPKKPKQKKNKNAFFNLTPTW